MVGGELSPVSPAETAAERSLPILRGDLEGLDELAAEAIALFVFADVHPLRGVAGYLDWRLCGALSEQLELGVLSGDEGETLLLPTSGRLGRLRLFVFGLGREATCTTEVLRAACRRAVDVMSRAGVREALIAAPETRRGDYETTFVTVAQAELAHERGRVRALLVERR